MHSYLKPFLALLILCLLSTSGYATHYIGNEVSYTSKGNNQYTVRFIYYQDCVHGDPTAIAQDEPLIIGLFNGTGQRLQVDSIYISSTTRVNPNTITGCKKSALACVQKVEFIRTYYLPPSSTPYLLVNQRCCLSDITNIQDPDQHGLTMSIEIKTVGDPNSSPAWKLPPPVLLATRQPFHIDYSATDPDGDSLAYRLVPVFDGGAANDAKPVPQSISAAPVPFRNGASFANPLFGAGSLTINPATGMITGVSRAEGSYLLAVACDDYRNGQKLSTSTRIFAFEFADILVTAAIPPVDSVIAAVGTQTDSIWVAQCNGNNTVRFHNQSIGGTSYSWDFGDPGTASDVSTLENPEYTYPGPGKYLVRLITNGSGCADTAVGYVLITDDIVGVDYSIAGKLCVNYTQDLLDMSVVTRGTISKYVWMYNDEVRYGPITNITFNQPNRQTIGHYIVTEKGCVTGISKDFDVYKVNVVTDNDTVITEGTKLQLHTTGALIYNWSPADYGDNRLDNPDIANPILSAAAAGREPLSFIVKGTDEQGCFGTDTINIVVSYYPYVTMPTAFTPNGDGRNDFLKAYTSGCKFGTFSIYTRGGKQIFTTTDSRAGWDGTYNGNQLDAGVYFWMVKVINAKGQPDVFKGDVTLIR